MSDDCGSRAGASSGNYASQVNQDVV
jgi:hypothetical protein